MNITFLGGTETVTTSIFSVGLNYRDSIKNTTIKLVHGAPEALEAMRDHLRRTTHYRVDVAGYQSILTL